MNFEMIREAARKAREEFDRKAAAVKLDTSRPCRSGFIIWPENAIEYTEKLDQAGLDWDVTPAGAILVSPGKMEQRAIAAAVEGMKPPCAA